MQLVSLYKKVPEQNKKLCSDIPVPQSIQLVKKCIDFRVTNYNTLNFRDLQYLVTLLDIDRVKAFLIDIEKQELNKRGISNVVHVTGDAAMLM